ncbi:dihydrofolate reductase family protein [Pseudonocardia adelaidensis]|uniref:Dihydrofolate reductase family protein n=1 Tax=Pseudonocardia adelaidensis TaxID=648754 RepID=A0ABP9NRK8_9PSEU
MGKVIVISFVTLDGVVEDPDGSGGTPQGGWAFRYGPEATAGDKFGLGPVLDTGVMVLGRTTWQLFSRIFGPRTDPFSQKMNAIPKIVASRSLERADGWQGSTVLQGGLDVEVARLTEDRDVVVPGSASVVDHLAARDLVDQYRLLVFPLVLGQGRRLFADGTAPVDLELTGTEALGPALRLVYDRHNIKES